MRLFQPRVISGAYIDSGTNLDELVRNISPSPLPRTEPAISPVISSSYELVEGPTYGKGLAELRRRIISNPSNYCQPSLDSQPVPLSLLETAVARIQHPELLNQGLDTSTSVAYSKSGKFCIIPVSRELCNLQEDYNQRDLSIDYSKITTRFKLSRDDTYNRLLSYGEVLNHRGWLALFENSTSLKEYRDLVFNELARRQSKRIQEVQGMGVWLSDTPSKDMLRAVWLSNIDDNSLAYCYSNLSSSVRFLLSKPPSSAPRSPK